MMQTAVTMKAIDWLSPRNVREWVAAVGGCLGACVVDGRVNAVGSVQFAPLHPEKKQRLSNSVEKPIQPNVLEPFFRFPTLRS